LGKDLKQVEFRVKNTASGFAQMLRRVLEIVEESQLHFVMESTGGYEFDVASFLASQGLRVSVVNPAFVKHFIRSRGWKNKTDQADARALAEFGVQNEPKPWRLSDPARREISQLRRHRERLTEELRRVQSYLEHENHHGEFEVKQLRSLQKSLLEAVEETERKLEAMVKAHDALSVQVQALMTLQGMGTAFAIAILCELGDSGDCESAESFAAKAGVSPCRSESGSKTGKTKIAKTGNAWVRKAGWMPAGSAIIHNPPIADLAKRLKAKGLTGNQIKVAAMRKLIMQAYGVLKALAAGTFELPKRSKPIRHRTTATRTYTKKIAKGIQCEKPLGWRTKAAIKKIHPNLRGSLD
jgi:transposase